MVKYGWMKAVLILIVSFLAEGALAAPLTITEHWSRCAANEIAPRPGTPLDVVGQLMLVCDEFPRRLTLVDREHPKTICVLDNGLSIRYQVGDLLHVQGVYTNDTSGFKRQIPNEHSPI